MIEEKDLVPYELAELPPPPWVVIAPHPDDETLGMGGTLALAARKNYTTSVIVLTDGALGGDPQIRENECLKAMKVLGVSEVHFLRLPDRGLYRLMSKLKKTLSALLEKKDWGTLFLPSPFEFHPDHRVAFWTVVEILAERKPGSSIWLYEISRQGEINRLINIEPVLNIKTQAIKCYSSQLLANDYLDISLALDRLRSYTISPIGVKWCEGFWASPACHLVDHLEKHLAKYKLCYRQLNYPKFAQR